MKSSLRDPMPQSGRLSIKPGQHHRSVGAAQRFLAPFSRISSHFRPRRLLLTASDYRTEMTERFTVWKTTTTMAITG